LHQIVANNLHAVLAMTGDDKLFS